MGNPASGKASANCDHLKELIREVPDFPKKGILFYDITTLLKDKTGFATLIDALSEHFISDKIDLVLGMEARGFIFGPAVAYRLNAGFVPVRKPGKLPAATQKYDYALEYGTNTLEIHSDAIQKGQRVIIVDDLLATGGTAEAIVERPNWFDQPVALPRYGKVFFDETKEGTRPLNLSLLAIHQKELIPVLRRHLSEAKDGRAIGVRRRQAAG